VTEAARPLAEATLKGCAANVGPLIGIDLEVGAVSIEESSEVPSGDLAVLPVSVEIDDKPLCHLQLWSPLAEIATLARRMLDDDDPDTVREINDDEADAIGEVLNLMSGAVDQSIREHVNASLRSRPVSWWRSDDPGDAKFPDGSFWIAQAAITIPAAGNIHVFFRLDPRLFQQGQEAKAKRTQGHILLIGLDSALQTSLSQILAQAQLSFDATQPGDPQLPEIMEKTDAIFVSGDGDEGLGLVRELRLQNHSWQIPSILCFAEPTKSAVIDALDAGASHVMAVPADEIAVLRVLRAARAEEA